MKNILWSSVILLAATGMCSAQSVLYFPQFVDGTQDKNSVVWLSLISITNPAAVGTPAATGTIKLTRDDGTPLTGTMYDLAGYTVNTFQLAGG
jgi:hypothetical protein